LKSGGPGLGELAGGELTDPLRRRVEAGVEDRAQPATRPGHACDEAMATAVTRSWTTISSVDVPAKPRSANSRRPTATSGERVIAACRAFWVPMP